jgi:hypothetical protein
MALKEYPAVQGYAAYRNTFWPWHCVCAQLYIHNIGKRRFYSAQCIKCCLQISAQWAVWFQVNLDQILIPFSPQILHLN